MTPRLARLHARQILDLSDQAASEDHVGRLQALGEATGAIPPDRPLGDLERQLLAVRAASFGPQLRALVSCPHCGVALGFELDVAALAEGNPPGGGEMPIEVEAGGCRLLARPPTLADLRRAADTGTVEGARAVLVATCLAPVEGASGEPSPEAVEAAGEALVAVEPFLELRLEPTCAACGATWSCVLDVGAFLWAELQAYATRLLDDVHALAGAYGWSEDQIVSLPDRRRRAYVERVAGG